MFPLPKTPEHSTTAGKRPVLVTLDGRYELQRELGRGSTGTVWEARDRLTFDVVAAKVVHPVKYSHSTVGQKEIQRAVGKVISRAGTVS